MACAGKKVRPAADGIGLAGISVDPNATALHDRPDDISADPVTQMTMRRDVQDQEVRPLPGFETPDVARAADRVGRVDGARDDRLRGNQAVVMTRERRGEL